VVFSVLAMGPAKDIRRVKRVPAVGKERFVLVLDAERAANSM
jgi:hypothetical protein